MISPTPLDRQHVLILGVGPGLGAGIARRFGREGFAVTLVARGEQSLDALAAELRGAGVGAGVDTVIADAGDSHAFRKTLDELAQRIAPGVVIYNAALVTSDSVLTSDEDHLLDTFAVNVLGAITAAQVFTPAMRQAGTGTFLATGGGLALHPHPDHGTLSIGKAGLRTAVSLLHDELEPEGVHVAGITVAGTIALGTAFDPDRIADTYWALHTQPAAEWTAETVFDGQ
jgi:short-subunit dehydrogenase